MKTKRKAKRDAEGCYHRTAFVTVTIGVGLIGPWPLEKEESWKAAALENFMDHPAIRGEGNLHDLETCVDRITWEEEAPHD